MGINFGNSARPGLDEGLAEYLTRQALSDGRTRPQLGPAIALFDCALAGITDPQARAKRIQSMLEEVK